jgi:hypothetical protein
VVLYLVFGIDILFRLRYERFTPVALHTQLARTVTNLYSYASDYKQRASYIYTCSNHLASNVNLYLSKHQGSHKPEQSLEQPPPPTPPTPNETTEPKPSVPRNVGRNSHDLPFHPSVTFITVSFSAKMFLYIGTLVRIFQDTNY